MTAPAVSAAGADAADAVDGADAVDAASTTSAASSVTAVAAIRVEVAGGTDAGSGVRVTTLESRVPLVLRDTTSRRASRPGESRGAEIHLVNAAGGPLAGDRLRLDVTVGPGARLVLRSAAATVALPGRGEGPSVFEIQADVGPGGALEVLLEPTVAAEGCQHRSVGTARLAAGASLLWREEILLGRFGEPSGTLATRLRVDVEGAPLLRQDLLLGPEVPGVGGPAVLGGVRAVGSLLVARAGGLPGLGFDPAVGERAARLPLAGPGVLVSALADDAVALRRALTELAGPLAPPGRSAVVA